MKPNNNIDLALMKKELKKEYDAYETIEITNVDQKGKEQKRGADEILDQNEVNNRRRSRTCIPTKNGLKP